MPPGRRTAAPSSSPRRPLRDQAAHADVYQSLFVLPAGGGEPQRLTGDEAGYSDPQFAADGSALYAPRHAQHEASSTTTRASCDSTGAERTRGPSPSVSSARSAASALRPAASRIYLLAEDEGHDRLYTVPASGGEVRELGRLEAGVISGLQVGGDEARSGVVANWETAINPPEIARIDAATGARQPLTSFNVERVAAIDWQPVQEFWFTSKRGRRIHNMIALPPGFDPAKKYPLFVLIHGGPHTMSRISSSSAGTTTCSPRPATSC